jgi:hypothetical protein
MNKNKKIIMTAVLALVILILLIVVFFRYSSQPRPEAGQSLSDQTVVNKPLETSLPGAPKFLDDTDKLNLGIATDSPIQIFRDASGDNVVYKILQTNDDVINDPTTITAVSPSKKLPTAK